MRGARVLLTATIFLLVATVAMARSPDAPEYTTMVDSDCWTCHKPGAFDPHMDPVVALAPEFIEAEAGAPFVLSVQAQSAWITSEKDYELLNWVVTLDLRGAPSMRFVSDRPPDDPVTLVDSIAYDPTLAAQDPTYLTAEHTGYVTLQIPEGATDVVIDMQPTDINPNTAPDLTMRVYPRLLAPTGDASREIDDAGPGQAEHFQANSPDVFGEFGFGNWTIEAATRVVDTQASRIIPAAGPIGYEVTMRAWFNASAEVQQVAVSNDRVNPEQKTLLPYTLRAESMPAAGEELRFIVNVTSHYEHDNKNDPAWWDFTFPYTVPINLDGDHFAIGVADGGLITSEAPSGVALAGLSEAIGYVGAFLLVSSVWTGGMFGKASRRQLNSLFGTARRRVAFHNFVSYGIIAFAIAHAFIFMWDVGTTLTDGYHWLVGVLWGGPSILAMLALGVTGALQVPMIRRWNYGLWRWTHFGLAIAAIVFTLVHMYLDGVNFADWRAPLNYKDPIVPEGFAS